MDQVHATGESFGTGKADSSDWREAPLLPSRVRAKAAIENALGLEDGPVLLTGDAGVGKTWLHRRIRTSFPESYRWLEVDLTASIDPVEFHRLILQRFGYEGSAGLAEARGLIADLLVDVSAGAERLVLILEEAHNATSAVLEETRILGNRLGRPDGFAGILLVGQNPLIRRLSSRSNLAMASRLAGRVHLRPLTFDEFREWVVGQEPKRSFSATDVEQLHRAIRGNPRRYLVEARQAGKPRTAIERPIPAILDGEDVYENGEESGQGQDHQTPTLPTVKGWEMPPVIPQKPPLQVADEMIEVGWDASSDVDMEQNNRLIAREQSGTDQGLSGGQSDGDGDGDGNGDGERSEERINDHYAALQAWTEWAQNQGREPVVSGLVAEKIDVAEHDPEGFNPLPDEESSWGGSGGTGALELRTEPRHASGHAPYGQLFSRLKEPRESTG